MMVTVSLASGDTVICYRFYSFKEGNDGKTASCGTESIVVLLSTDSGSKNAFH